MKSPNTGPQGRILRTKFLSYGRVPFPEVNHWISSKSTKQAQNLRLKPITSSNSMLRYATIRYIILWYVTSDSYDVRLCFVALRYITLRYITLCYLTLCHNVSNYVTLCPLTHGTAVRQDSFRHNITCTCATCMHLRYAKPRTSRYVIVTLRNFGLRYVSFPIVSVSFSS